MDVRIKIAAVGDSVKVSKFCQDNQISRQTFYKWRVRYQAEGLDGLSERSRRPHSSPNETPPQTGDRIAELRKQLGDDGLDHGPGTIQWHLGRDDRVQRVPSEATIYRILQRQGSITPEPRKRPKRSWRRFEASAPNELWQADVINWVVADHGRTIQVISFIDDHSRVALRCRAVEVATTLNTWETFSDSALQWGLPVGQLSDNGVNFSGRLRGFEVAFEINLRAAGVRPITSRPYHPQTCGKVERFQQTLKKWLRRQPLARDLAELQDQLDWFVDYYNHQRPHRGIGRVTPTERFAATPPAINLGIALPGGQHQTTVVVDHRGCAEMHRYLIHVGVIHKGATAHVLYDDTHAAVFIHGCLIRHLQLDHSRRYQPSGLPRGRRRLP
jgi:transposase InsO family protein